MAEWAWMLCGVAFLAATSGWYLAGLGILSRGSTQLAQAYPPLSIVVAAHNEAPRLEAFLESLFDQKYPVFEVVLVLNGCQDDSLEKAEKWQRKEPRLRLLNVPEPGKKNAIEAGIRAAQHEVLVFTDADCRPASPFWLREMAAALRPPFRGVLGYSPVMPGRGWLNRVARFDHFSVGIQYLGAAAWGFPYMAVGRNLLYERTVFDAVGGFSSHRHLASGDDDLLVQAAARRFKFQVQWRPESFVMTEAPVSWGHFIRRKTRHFTTGRAYRPLPLMLLQAHFLGRLGTWLSPLILFFIGAPVASCFFFLFFYLLLSVWMWKPLSTKLCEKRLWFHGVWCDAVLTFVHCIAGISSLFRNTKRWM
ncbi:MAG: glycosyltransferase [Flavobacteriales bacterium]|nr:glycosyltransferase [Flavobacteriales bacterium]MCX7650399.1 glycosyltransferase [Flavobacteriales bacterium]MDW8433082.1 glycosyltransferase [Flavobacteriales bacterium]